MKRLLFLLTCATLLRAAPASAQYIWLDLSFKAVLNPTTGARFYSFTEADIDATIAQMNQLLARYQRGYRMRRVDPLYDVGSTNDPNGPSKWFYMDPGAPYPLNTNIDLQHEMDAEARANPVLYRWNFNAVNFYILGDTNGSATDTNGQQVGRLDACGCPPPAYIITTRTVSACYATALLHETGHWFALDHPHHNCVKENGVCGGNPANCAVALNGFLLGDDGIQDTLPMQAGDYCFTNQDLIALANFRIPYASCSPEQANLVDDVFFNLMSYGFDRPLDRLTPQQLDLWTDTANLVRYFALSGFTRYVSSSGDDLNFGLTSTLAKRTVLNTLITCSPAGGDIVLLRPGQYNERITINRPVTLRAPPTNSFAAYPRWATIGKP